MIYTLTSRITKSFWLLKDFVKRENFVKRDHLEPNKVTLLICLLTIILWLTNNFVNFKAHLFSCKYIFIYLLNDDNLQYNEKEYRHEY